MATSRSTLRVAESIGPVLPATDESIRKTQRLIANYALQTRPTYEAAGAETVILLMALGIDRRV